MQFNTEQWYGPIGEVHHNPKQKVKLTSSKVKNLKFYECFSQKLIFFATKLNLHFAFVEVLLGTCTMPTKWIKVLITLKSLSYFLSFISQFVERYLAYLNICFFFWIKKFLPFMNFSIFSNFFTASRLTNFSVSLSIISCNFTNIYYLNYCGAWKILIQWGF